jgi:hypothetical protein
MRFAALALLLVPAMLASACGSDSAKTYSVRDVERALYRAGVPF